MSGPGELATICAILFMAALVRSTIGFGEAIIAMPLLALVVPLRVAAPLVALVAACNGIVILIREWQHVSFRSAARLIVPAVTAVPLGVLLIQHGNERVVKALLACLLLAYATWSMRRSGGFALRNDRWAPLAGFLGGLLGGAYNTSGPPVVVYGTLRRWPPEQFRATLQSYFTVGSLWVLTIHLFNGLLTQRVLTTFAICIPMFAVAHFLGWHLSRKLPAERFRLAVHVTMIAIGSLLLASAIG